MSPFLPWAKTIRQHLEKNRGSRRQSLWKYPISPDLQQVFHQYIAILLCIPYSAPVLCQFQPPFPVQQNCLFRTEPPPSARFEHKNPHNNQILYKFRYLCLKWQLLSTVSIYPSSFITHLFSIIHLISDFIRFSVPLLYRYYFKIQLVLSALVYSDAFHTPNIKLPINKITGNTVSLSYVSLSDLLSLLYESCNSIIFVQT